MNHFEYTPTGKLVFEIDEYCAHGIKKRWTDSKRKPLEPQMNDIITGIVTAAAALEVDNIRRQEQERRRLEEQVRRQKEEQRRREEEQRFQAVEHHVNLWIRSRNLREFLSEWERSIVEDLGPLDRDGPVSKWLDWANRQTDRLDPFKNGVLKEALAKLKKPAEST